MRRRINDSPHLLSCFGIMYACLVMDSRNYDIQLVLFVGNIEQKSWVQYQFGFPRLLGPREESIQVGTQVTLRCRASTATKSADQ
jgi:hypothetical protein